MGASRDPDDRYRGQYSPQVEPETVEREGVLAKVPEWVVPLGAGFLFTATLVAGTVFVLLLYPLVTGDYGGVFEVARPYAPRLGFVVLQFALATLFLGAGTYFARRRTHWGTVLLTGIFGSLAFVTLPFTVPALVLLGLGRYHFALTTPVDRIRGE